MDPLATILIEAHGGLDRWRRFDAVSADLSQGGALWALKGHPDTLARTQVTVGLRSEWASHHPFGPQGLRSRFTPDRVSLERADGSVEDRLAAPRASFVGDDLTTLWSALQLAYFAGCAMWTYLNTPFVLAWPGVQAEEVDPLSERGETWRRVRVRSPAEIATHSTVQTLFIGPDGLLRRHDYDVDITGGTPGAHLISAYTDVSGIKFPTRRRIFPRAADGSAASEPLVVSIDLSNITLHA